MSNKFTTTYVQDRIKALLPQPVSIDRTGSTDADDLLDSVKERVARALYTDQDAAYYLVLLAVAACKENIATLLSSTTAMTKYGVALRTTPGMIPVTAPVIDTTGVIDTVQLNLVKKLQAALVTTAQITKGVTGITQDKIVAQELFDHACDDYTKTWKIVQTQLDAIARFLAVYNKVDLTIQIINRQARQLQTVLDQHYASEQLSTAAAVDMLIGAKLFDHVSSKVDITRNKFNGTATASTATTVTLPTETIKTYWVRHGDSVYSNDGSLILQGTVASVSGQKVTVAGATDLTVYHQLFVIKSLGMLSYNTLCSALAAVDTSSFLTDTLVTQAKTFASTGAQSTLFYSTLQAATTAATAAKDALTAYQAGKVMSVASLLSALREESLVPVIDKLLLLDLAGVQALTFSDFSTHDTAASLLSELADLLSMGDATADIVEAPSTLDAYTARPTETTLIVR